MLPARDPVPLSNALMADPRIRKVTFTSSTEVGRILYRKAADTVKRISLELGGHAPVLVFEDAEFNLAVDEVIACKYRNAGQTCVCTNRIYVQAPIVEAFTEAYIAATQELTVGDPLDEETDIGPLVDEQGLRKVTEHLHDAVARGATVVAGGGPHKGLFFEPTVLTGVTPDMKLMHEETFGPVAPIISFDTEEEAVRMANDTPYGLAAYLYTNDLARAFRVSEALDYGIVGVNDGVPSAPYAPFGGVKQSGLGREGGPGVSRSTSRSSTSRSSCHADVLLESGRLLAPHPSLVPAGIVRLFPDGGCRRLPTNLSRHTRVQQPAN